MCATRAVLVLLFAVIACAVAIPATLPQPVAPVAPGAVAAAVGIQQRGPLEKREIDAIEAGAEQNQDLKGSASYGYGYYGYPGYYRPYGYGHGYGYGYGYPYGGYGYGYGYPYYRGFGYGGYYPYGYYGGFW